jgi:hypothetical protein
MGYLTKLDAVNQMLLAAGESLVADLNEASGIDTGISEFLLDQASLEYQLRGLANNKIIKTVQPDAQGYILLGYPNTDFGGVLDAKLLSLHQTEDGSAIVARVQEGNPPKLWNMTEDTDVWVGGDYRIEQINFLQYDQLDTNSQRTILSAATRKYQLYTQADPAVDNYLAQREMLDRMRSRANDISAKQRTIWANDVSYAAGKRPPYFGTDPAAIRRGLI